MARVRRGLLRVAAVAALASFGAGSIPAHAAQETRLGDGLLYQNCPSGGGWFSPPNTEAKTRYPIVLVAGTTGSAPNHLLPGLRYWHQIPEALCSRGATVYVAALPGINGIEPIGEELVKQIQLLEAVLGVEKVNLVGHSLGGATTRYAAAVYPEGVASVTTIAGGHKGTELGSFLQNHGPLPVAIGEALFSVLGLWANAINGQDQDVDAYALMRDVTPEAIAEFNRLYPSDGVSSASCTGQDEDRGERKTFDTRTGTDGRQYVQKLYSWTGNNPAPLTSIDIVTNALMLATSTAMRSEGAGVNDGIVGVCSSRFGKVTGTYDWNHLNEINQLQGLVPLLAPNPKTVIVNHANRLRNEGL